MECRQCKNTTLVEGSLEGVSFQPKSEHKKWISSGIYGINALVCPECGSLSDFKLDAGAIDALKKIITRTK
jgi:hypothetical protein